MRFLSLMFLVLTMPVVALAQTGEISDFRIVDGKVLPGHSVLIQYKVQLDRPVEYRGAPYNHLYFIDGSGKLYYSWAIPDAQASGQYTGSLLHSSSAEIQSNNRIRVRHRLNLTDASFVNCGDKRRCLKFDVKSRAVSEGISTVTATNTHLFPSDVPPLDDDQLATEDISDQVNTTEIDTDAFPSNPSGDLNSVEIKDDWSIEFTGEISDIPVSSDANIHQFPVNINWHRTSENISQIYIGCFDEDGTDLYTHSNSPIQFAENETGRNLTIFCTRKAHLNVPDGEIEVWRPTIELRAEPPILGNGYQPFDAKSSNDRIQLEIPIASKLNAPDGPIDPNATDFGIMDVTSRTRSVSDPTQVKFEVKIVQHDPSDQISDRIRLGVRTNSGGGDGYTLPDNQEGLHTGSVDTVINPIDIDNAIERDGERYVPIKFYLSRKGRPGNLISIGDRDPSNDRFTFLMPVDPWEQTEPDESDEPGSESAGSDETETVTDPQTDSDCLAACFAKCDQIAGPGQVLEDSACAQFPVLPVCQSQSGAAQSQVDYCKRTACTTPEAARTCEPTGLPTVGGISSGSGGDSGRGDSGGGGPDGGGPDGGGSDGGGPGSGGPEDCVGCGGSGPGPGGGGSGGGGAGISPPKCYWHSCGWGDPHLVSFDGVAFDFQGVGEFWLARTEDRSIGLQARMEPYGRDVSVISALALGIGDDQVSIYSNRDVPIFLNGTPLELQTGIYNAYTAASDIYIVRTGERAYEIVFPNDMKLRVKTSSYLNFDVMAPDMTALGLTGLLGSADGRPSNDFGLPDGEYIPHSRGNIGFEDLYKRFGNSWRISQEESLFIYADGESTETFTDLDYPARHLTIDDLADADRERAAKICRDAGITDPRLLETCIYDVGFTGDASFAEDYDGLVLGSPATDASGPATLSAPERVKAGSAVTVEWSGPANSGDFISLARPDQAGGRYEAYDWAKPGSDSVSLVAPGTPGEYELRYVRYNDREIIARRQIMVTETEATLSAPARVETGAAITVVWTGPANKGDFISLARPDQIGGHYETYDWVKPEGAPVRLTVPDKPGTYELRYILSSDRIILVRRSLTVE